METKICSKCNKEKDIKQYYKHTHQYFKNNHQNKHKEQHISSWCKDCIQEQYNPYNENTFMWVLEELDCVYYKSKYQQFIEWSKEHYPNDENKIKRSILGRFISFMDLNHFRFYKFKDSEELNKLDELCKVRTELIAQGNDLHEIMNICSQYDNIQKIIDYFKDKKNK